MSATVSTLLHKDEQALADYVGTLSQEHIQTLFSELWDSVRKTPLYAGQARSMASTDALSLSKLALSVASCLEAAAFRAEAERMMAYVLNANEQFEESIGHYSEAIALLEQQGAFDKAARTRIGFVAALFMTGRYDRGMQEAQRADDWLLKNHDEDGRARLHANLGNMFHRLDQHARAVKYHNTAIKVFRKLKNQAALAQCYVNLADSLSILDRMDEADRTFEQGQKLSQKLNLEHLYTLAKYNRSYLHFLRGRYSEAIQGMGELRVHYNQTGSARHAALCDLDESEMYLHLNLTEEALNLAKRAAVSFKELGMTYEEAKARAFFGIGLTHNQQANEALEVFRQSQLLFEKESNSYWAASLELYRAQVHFMLGRFWEAQSLALSAKERFSRLNIPSKKAIVLVLLTRITLELGATDQASGYAEEIAQLMEKTAIPLHVFPCYSVSAQVAEYRGDFHGAEKFYKLAAQEMEIHRSNLPHDKLRVTFFKGKQQVYEALVRLALGRTDSSERVIGAYNWCERAKSRGLVDLLSQHLPSANPHGDQSLLNRIKHLHEELNSYYIRESRDGNVSGIIAEVEVKRNELASSLKELSNQDPEYASLQRVSIASVEDVQEALPADTTLVEYFVARDEILVFLITKHGATVHRHLCTVDRVQHLQERLRLQLDKFLIGSKYINQHAQQLQESTLRHLGDLYTELIAPLASHLTTRHLIIVPHSVLHYVPFHALYDGKQYLIDRHTVSYAPSATVLKFCIERKPIRDASPLIIGVPDERAPQIAQEVKHLKKLFPDARTYSGRRATRKAVLRQAAQADFVHMATHAVFRTDNPMFSHLKLADGTLAAIDLYSMTCQANLVTLSGCRSGASEVAGADELLGLMRGFLYAGARSLLLSLWDVNDRSTSKFMGIFYQSWLGGMTKAESLQAAMQKLRAEEPHPYFWAPFVLIGNP